MDFNTPTGALLAPKTMGQEIRGPHESLRPRRCVGQSAIKADVEDKRPAGRIADRPEIANGVASEKHQTDPRGYFCIYVYAQNFPDFA